MFAIPVYTRPKVAPDRHVEIARALYSVPGELIGQRLVARADAQTVKLFHRGQLIKVHPRQEPGRRRTDPADMPSEVAIYALRDLDALHRRARGHGEHIGAYAAAVLDHPLPWTKMRQVYRLLGLVRRHGAERVEQACQRALDAEAVNVGLIERMLIRGLEGEHDTSAAHSRAAAAGQGEVPDAASASPTVVLAAGRFVRDAGEFATGARPARPVRRPS